MSTSDDRRLPMVPSRPQGQPPIFEKIAIIGLGLIGGSISIAAKQTWPAGLVIAVDRKDVLEQAMVRHAIDVAADELYVISEADLVVLAAPVLQNIELIDQLEEVIPGQAVVTDVGSTKRAIVEAARALPARFTFVGGHPLGGAAALRSPAPICSPAVPGSSPRTPTARAPRSRSCSRSQPRSARDRAR